MAKGRAKAASSKPKTSVNIGYEAGLWVMDDALRANLDAAEYKHVVLGLIFLKYISDAFEAMHVELEAQKAQGADPEDRDEYRAASIFWVPKEAGWQHPNPPLNDSDWRGEMLKDDKRRVCGTPPAGRRLPQAWRRQGSLHQ